MWFMGLGASIKGAIIAALLLAAMGSGAYLMRWWDGSEIKNLTTERDNYKRNYETCQSNESKLKDSIEFQNGKIKEYLSEAAKRKKESADALTQANARAAGKNKSATQILQSKPLDADSCKSAVLRSQQWAERRK